MRLEMKMINFKFRRKNCLMK